MKYNYKGRIFNIADDLVQKFNEGFAGTEKIDDNLIELFISVSNNYNEEKNNILEVLDQLIEEGSVDDYIEKRIKAELLID